MQKQKMLMKTLEDLFIIFLSKELVDEERYELEEVVEKRFISSLDDVNHMLIEGDNLFALQALLPFYKESIHCIIIDPPYNTKRKDLGYHDTFPSDIEWIKFMKPRLELAKKLLREDGFIFIHINDNELPYLHMLCSFIFGKENFVSVFPWIKSTKKVEEMEEDEPISLSGNNLGNIRIGHEYVLCFRKTLQASFSLFPPESEWINSRITNVSNPISRLILPKGICCEKNITQTFIHCVGGPSEPIYILSPEGMVIRNGVLQNDVLLEGRFRNPNMISKVIKGEKVFDKRGQEVLGIFLNKNGVPYLRKKKLGEIPISVLSGFGDSSRWSNLIKEIVGDKDGLVFPYPKPYPLAKKLIQMATSDPNAIILDFFAGSGTTGHAVLELNYEDNGKRKSILINNNENRICENITYVRLRKVMEGYCTSNKQVHGLGGNLHYFRVKEKRIQ